MNGNNRILLITTVPAGIFEYRRRISLGRMSWNLSAHTVGSRTMLSESQIPFWHGFGDGTLAGVLVGRLTRESWPKNKFQKNLEIDQAAILRYGTFLIVRPRSRKCLAPPNQMLPVPCVAIGRLAWFSNEFVSNEPRIFGSEKFQQQSRILFISPNRMMRMPNLRRIR